MEFNEGAWKPYLIFIRKEEKYQKALRKAYKKLEDCNWDINKSGYDVDNQIKLFKDKNPGFLIKELLDYEFETGLPKVYKVENMINRNKLYYTLLFVWGLDIPGVGLEDHLFDLEQVTTSFRINNDDFIPVNHHHKMHYLPSTANACGNLINNKLVYLFEKGSHYPFHVQKMEINGMKHFKTRIDNLPVKLGNPHNRNYTLIKPSEYEFEDEVIKLNEVPDCTLKHELRFGKKPKRMEIKINPLWSIKEPHLMDTLKGSIMGAIQAGFSHAKQFLEKII